MPLILIILAMPFIILVWMARFLSSAHDRQSEAPMWDAIAKAKQDAKIARPLKDYVDSLSSRTPSKTPVPFRLGTISPPTPGNIGRFAALSFRSQSEEYFVRDGDGAIYGPADHATICQWVSESRISGDTLMGSHSEGPWLPAQRIRALQDAFQIAAQSSVSNGRFEHIQIE